MHLSNDIFNHAKAIKMCMKPTVKAQATIQITVSML